MLWIFVLVKTRTTVSIMAMVKFYPICFSLPLFSDTFAHTPAHIEWYTYKHNAKPVLNMMMLDMLKRRQEEDPAKYVSVTLMLDAMAIKKHIQYNTQTQNMVWMKQMLPQRLLFSWWLAYKGIGRLQLPTTSPTLSPDTQKVLILHALKELHERGIRVLCITMDLAWNMLQVYSPIKSSTGQINWTHIV